MRGERQRVQPARTPRAPGAGEPLAPGGCAATRRRGRRPRRPPGRRPAAGPRPRPERAATAHSRTPGWRGSAASTSPGSTRKPRTLTCSSARPRNSSRPSARQRARSPVRYRRAPACRANGVGDERPGGHVRPPQVAAGDACAAHVQLARRAHGDRAERGVQHVQPHPRQRPADRRRAAGLRDQAERRVHGALGGTVQVPEAARRVGGQALPGGRVQRLAGHQHVREAGACGVQRRPGQERAELDRGAVQHLRLPLPQRRREGGRVGARLLRDHHQRAPGQQPQQTA